MNPKELAQRLRDHIDSMLGVAGAEKLAEAVFDAIEYLDKS